MGGAQSKPQPTAAAKTATTHHSHRGRRTCRQFKDCKDSSSRHKSQFIHSSDIPSYIDYSERPPCRYWETCYRRDDTKSGHMARYLHPWELPDSDEVRAVLIGKTGVGKSLSSNTLLGEEKFESVLSFQSQTSSCQYGYQYHCGKKYMIVDTPGIFDTKIDEKQNAIELLKCLGLCAPGPHVFFITIAIGQGRFTDEDEKTIETCCKIFGDGMLKHAVILFTCGDRLIEENKTKDELLSDCPKSLQKLIKDCGGRTFVLNNKASREERTNQAKDLVMKVNEWGLDRKVYEDKHGLFKETENVFMNEQRDGNTSREDIRQSIMRNLRKAKPYMILVVKAVGPILGMIPHPYAKVVSGVMNVAGNMLIIPLLNLWLKEDETKDNFG